MLWWNGTFDTVLEMRGSIGGDAIKAFAFVLEFLLLFSFFFPEFSFGYFLKNLFTLRYHTFYTLFFCVVISSP